ncbi:MAG: hypothetical protein ACJ72N_08530 [Labedaea sp.]
MDQGAVLAAFDEQLRAGPRPSIFGGRFERDGRVIRCVGEHPDDWSGIDWSDLDEDNADEVIAGQVRWFAERGRRFEWKYYTHDRPADLPERLRRAGLEPGPEEALMVADIAEPAAGPTADPQADPTADRLLPAGVRLVPVSDAAGIALLVGLHEEVFGDDFAGFGRTLLHRLEHSPGSVVPVLAMAGDRAVCGARIDFHPGTEFASLWGGGTLKAWRGKGIYRATVAYRARLAAERGFRYLRVDALPTSDPILTRLGFVRLSTTVPFTFTP